MGSLRPAARLSGRALAIAAADLRHLVPSLHPHSRAPPIRHAAAVRCRGVPRPRPSLGGALAPARRAAPRVPASHCACSFSSQGACALSSAARVNYFALSLPVSVRLCCFFCSRPAGLAPSLPSPLKPFPVPAPPAASALSPPSASILSSFHFRRLQFPNLCPLCDHTCALALFSFP